VVAIDGDQSNSMITVRPERKWDQNAAIPRFCCQLCQNISQPETVKAWHIAGAAAGATLVTGLAGIKCSRKLFIAMSVSGTAVQEFACVPKHPELHNQNNRNKQYE